MDNEMLAILTGSGAAGEGTSAPTSGTGNKSDKLIEALTERLTKQGQGISSSSSSNLQAEIEKAMKGTEKAGALTAERLQSERAREVSFARGEAGDTYTTALEGRTGYATQVAGLRRLTETTEKSVRDLDQRYQEALMANDANTASQIAGLRMQKLEFLERQEQNFYNNLFALGNLQEQALNRAQQNEQFWLKRDQDNKQFVLQLTQSKYEFEKNYGLQLEQLGLDEKRLEIERSRNNLSWQEYRDRKAEIEKEKLSTGLSAKITSDLRREVTELGKDPSQIDPVSYALWAYENYAVRDSGLEYEDVITAAYAAQEAITASGLKPESTGPTRQGGAITSGAKFIAAPWIAGYQGLMDWGFGEKK